MSDIPDGLSCRHVLVFRETVVWQNGSVTETSLYRSKLSGNHLIEQQIQDGNEIVTSLVILNEETIRRLLIQFRRIIQE